MTGGRIGAEIPAILPMLYVTCTYSTCRLSLPQGLQTLGTNDGTDVQGFPTRSVVLPPNDIPLFPIAD